MIDIPYDESCVTPERYIYLTGIEEEIYRPEGLVIQMIDPDMTKPALVTRMDEAEGHFVYVKLNELDLFELLPDEFTLDDAIRVRRQQGLPDKGASHMVQMWKHRNYVSQITDHSFQKTEKYKNK